MKGLSTTHALVDMVHNWLVTAEQKMASHVVLLDCRKAFDHVDHRVLVNKCKMFGTLDCLDSSLDGLGLFFQTGPRG